MYVVIGLIRYLAKFGNFRLSLEDSSGALQRRIRIFNADNIIKPKDQKDLFNYQKGKWSGLLLQDLPGIFNWISEVNLEEAKEFVKNNLTNDNELNNPLKQWCDKNLIRVDNGERSYLGGKMGTSNAEMIEAQRRGLLYPFYHLWCQRRDYIPIKHNKFSKELVNQFESGVSLVSRNQGRFVLGFKFKNKVGTKDNSSAGPLICQLHTILESVTPLI